MTDQNKKFEDMNEAAREAGLPVPSDEELAELKSLWAGLEETLTPPARDTTRPSFSRISGFETFRPRRGKVVSIFRSVPTWAWMSSVAALVVFGVLIMQSLMMRATVDHLEAKLDQMRVSLILASLRSDSAADRLDGILQLSEADSADPNLIRAVLRRLEYDPNTNVRLASVRTLLPYADEPVVLTTLEAAVRREQSPMVALEILEVLRNREPARAEALWEEIRGEDRFGPLLENVSGQDPNHSTTKL